MLSILWRSSLCWSRLCELVIGLWEPRGQEAEAALSRQAWLPHAAPLQPPASPACCRVSLHETHAIALSHISVSPSSMFNLPLHLPALLQCSHRFAPLQGAGEEVVQTSGSYKDVGLWAKHPSPAVAGEHDISHGWSGQAPTSMDSPKQKQKSKATNMKLVCSSES